MIKPLVLFALIFWPAKNLIENVRDGSYGHAALWFLAVWIIFTAVTAIDRRVSPSSPSPLPDA